MELKFVKRYSQQYNKVCRKMPVLRQPLKNLGEWFTGKRMSENTLFHLRQSAYQSFISSEQIV